MENNRSDQNKRYKLEDFELYKTAREFRKKVYEVIKALPREEKHNLASQMRRASVSISNNIAEGHGRWHHQENIQFCRISRGSVEEIIDDINVCIDEGYCPGFNLIRLKNEGYDLIRRINGYMVPTHPQTPSLKREGVLRSKGGECYIAYLKKNQRMARK